MKIEFDIKYRYLGIICVWNHFVLVMLCVGNNKCYSKHSIHYFKTQITRQENSHCSLMPKSSVSNKFSTAKQSLNISLRNESNRKTVMNHEKHDVAEKGLKPNIISEECRRMLFSNETSQPSVLASFGDGRLGNQMCNFASQYALNKKYGVLSYFSDRSYNTLDITFNLPQPNQRNSSFHLWNLTCAYPRDLDWKHVTNTQLMNTRLRDYIFKKLQYSSYIRLESYVCDIQGFLHHLQVLRRDFFRFYPEDMKQAKSIEKKVRSTKKNSVFVSIHVRLKDMGRHLTMFNLTVASPIYFENAMHHMRKKFGKKVIFAVLSDEIKKARKLFPKAVQSKFNIMFPSFGDSPRTSSITLALLSLADHSILTYSTFGLWGALLRKTNGEILMPQEINKTDTGYYALNANIPGLKFL